MHQYDERVYASFAKHMERSVDSTNTLNFVAVMNDIDVQNISVYRGNWYSQISFFFLHICFMPLEINIHTYLHKSIFYV